MRRTTLTSTMIVMMKKVARKGVKGGALQPLCLSERKGGKERT